LPNSKGEQLGVLLFETLGTRIKRNISIGGNQRWGEDEWLPQRIIETYGSLGTRWELGLPDSDLHAQSNHQVISSGRNFHQLECSALEFLARQQT
jgi:hypothetical protein